MTRRIGEHSTVTFAGSRRVLDADARRLISFVDRSPLALALLSAQAGVQTGLAEYDSCCVWARGAEKSCVRAARRSGCVGCGAASMGIRCDVALDAPARARRCGLLHLC